MRTPTAFERERAEGEGAFFGRSELYHKKWTRKSCECSISNKEVQKMEKFTQEQRKLNKTNPLTKNY